MSRSAVHRIPSAVGCGAACLGARWRPWAEEERPEERAVATGGDRGAAGRKNCPDYGRNRKNKKALV